MKINNKKNSLSDAKEKGRKILISYYDYKKQLYELLANNLRDKNLSPAEEINSLKERIKEIEPVVEEMRQNKRRDDRFDFIGYYLSIEKEKYSLIEEVEKKNSIKAKKKLVDIENEITKQKPKFEKIMQKERINHILHEYKFNPINFNNHHPENEYWGNDAEMLLQFFCDSVSNNNSISPDLLNYLRDCVQKYLSGGLSLERCFNLVGRKPQNPIEYPDYLEDIFSDILDRKLTFTKAFKESQKRGVDKSEKRMSNQLHDYAHLVLQDWLLGKMIKKQDKEPGSKLTLSDLKDWQIKLLSSSFGIDLNHVKDDLTKWLYSLVNSTKK